MQTYVTCKQTSSRTYAVGVVRHSRRHRRLTYTWWSVSEGCPACATSAVWCSTRTISGVWRTTWRCTKRMTSMCAVGTVNILWSSHTWYLSGVNYSLNNGLYCTKHAHSHLLFGQHLNGLKIMSCAPIFGNCLDWKNHKIVYALWISGVNWPLWTQSQMRFAQLFIGIA